MPQPNNKTHVIILALARHTIFVYLQPHIYKIHLGSTQENDHGQFYSDIIDQLPNQLGLCSRDGTPQGE